MTETKTLQTPKADALKAAIDKSKVVTTVSAEEAVLQVALAELNMKQEIGKPYP
jgi:hypothetical protein